MVNIDKITMREGNFHAGRDLKLGIIVNISFKKEFVEEMRAKGFGTYFNADNEMHLRLFVADFGKKYAVALSNGLGALSQMPTADLLLVIASVVFLNVRDTPLQNIMRQILKSELLDGDDSDAQ